MRKVILVVMVVMLLGSLAPTLWSQDAEGSLVIIFQDGHRQTLRLAEISRIEFRQPSSNAAAEPLMSRSRFVGHWRVGIGGGDNGTFEIDLKANGRAHKSIGSTDGTWKVVNGEARISWDDGWTDVILKAGGKFRKEAYEPGRSVDGNPNSVASAEYLEAQ